MTIVIDYGHYIKIGTYLTQQTRRQQQGAATSQRLYETALQLFATQGYEETTVESIARAAGVAKGTFFVHFPSKEAVLAHLGKQQMQRLFTAITENPSFASADIRTQLRLVYRTLADGVDVQPELARKYTRVMLQSDYAFDNQLLGVDLLDELLLPIIRAAQTRGELRADATAEELTLLIRGTYFVVITAWFQRPDVPLVSQAARALELLLSGLT